MRLFLSSQDFGKYADVAIKMAGDNKKAAFIRNSQDHLPADERNKSMPEKKKMFERAGFEFEEVDLRNYFGKTIELEKKLESFGSIWCSGGNTFVLRRALASSGLDDLLIKWLKADRILYGGWSAGSCVAAPSLKGAENGDWPNSDIVPEEYPIKETIWEGLGLIPLMIVPHCDQEWYKEECKATIAYFKKHKLPYEALNDGQVVIVDDDKTEVLK